MRRIAIILGCAAALSVGAAAAGQQFYRVDLRLSNARADDQSFIRDRDQCFLATNTSHPLVTEDIRPGSTSHVFHVTATEHHAAAFYQCMTARGYRTDPNGRFTASFSSSL